MKRNNLSNIGFVIKKLMHNAKLVNKLEKLDALEIWKNIIGKDLKQYITENKIRNSVLYVKLNSSVLRNELSYKKSELLDEINKKIGKEFLKDIILK